MRRRPKSSSRPPYDYDYDYDRDRDRQPSSQSSNKSSGGGIGKLISSTTMAILAGVFILGLGIGIAFSSTANFNPQNVASRVVIDRSAPSSELCVQYGASAITMDLRAFVTLNPFNVYVSQPLMQPGCVMRSNNLSILEQRGQVTGQDVRECRNRLNTFGFTGDLEDSTDEVEVDCVYQNDSARNLFLDQPGLRDSLPESDRF